MPAVPDEANDALWDMGALTSLLGELASDVDSAVVADSLPTALGRESWDLAEHHDGIKSSPDVGGETARE